MSKAVGEHSGWTGLGRLSVVLSLLGLGAMLVLLAGSMPGWSAPGCGADSACGRVTSGVWGRVPVLGLPVSAVGAAWFAGIGVSLLVGRGRAVGAARWLVRIAAVVSVVYLAVMARLGEVCSYCLVAHACNFGLLFLVGFGRPGDREVAGRVGAASGVVVLVLLSLAWWGAGRATEAEDTRAAEETAERVIEAIGEESDEADWFTGRYRIGPDEAAVRVVVISDYQCADCKRVEGELWDVFEARDDVSLSMKHFPFCGDCNRHVRGTPHPNACWAARASETAGRLGGVDGFWQMHRWLFDRGGGFSAEELDEVLLEMGFDRDAFLAEMRGASVLEDVHVDIEEAVSLGLHYTPMVFVNGMEIRGWRTPGVVRSSVERIADAAAELRDARDDRPALAAEKYMDDWRSGERVEDWMSADAWWDGDGAVEVVVYGDYGVAQSLEADRVIESMRDSGVGLEYSFRMYPASSTCNPAVQVREDAQACLAAKCALAAGLLLGPEGFWEAHRWLIALDGDLSGLDYAGVASAVGVDAGDLEAMAESRDVDRLLREHLAAGRKVRGRGVPMVVVDGRFVPRWYLGGQPMLERFLEEATKARGHSGTE